MTEQREHPGIRRIEKWLIGEGYSITENGMFDDETRDAMRDVLLTRTGWDSEGQRHRAVMGQMAELMNDPELLTEVYGA